MFQKARNLKLPKKTKVVGFTLILLAACASSEIGGEVVFREVEGKQSSEVSGFCTASCKKEDGGICVQFSDQISTVCQKHFLRVAEVRGQTLSRSTSRNCSPNISNVTGVVNISYSDSCN